MMQRAGSIYTNLFIVILLFISAFVILNIFSKIQEKKSSENWTNTFGPIEDLPNKYPYRNDNEAAVQLKLLGARLGIDFAVYGEGHRYSPSAWDAKRFRELGHNFNLWMYQRRQLERADEAVDPPPPLLAAYLADYGNELDTVRNYILTATPILWRQNLNWSDNFGPNPALPRMAGISELQTIFIIRALELSAGKRYEEAEKYLEAGWKLNESLKSRCDLSSQLDALWTDKRLMSLMRKLPLGTDWIQKVGKHNYEKAFVKGFQVEAWFLWRKRNEEKMTKTPLLNNLLDSYVYLGVSSLLENERTDIQRIASLNPCSLGYKDFREVQSYESPEWNRIRTRGHLLDKNSTYAEITEIKLLRELTAKIIQLRHGFFPKDGSERSEVCKDGTWDYWRLPEGSTSIKYKGRLELPSTPPVKFPTPFTVKTS